MNFKNIPQQSQELQAQAWHSLRKGNYYQAMELYEQVITAEPDCKLNYWYLGLTFVLQGEETEAQTIWLMAMMEGNTQEVEQWNNELSQILRDEATRQESLEAYGLASQIRQQIREIFPQDAQNYIKLIHNLIQLDECTSQDLEILIQLLNQSQENINFEELKSILETALDNQYLQGSAFKFAQTCSLYLQNKEQILTFCKILIPRGINLGYIEQKPKLAANLIELACQFQNTPIPEIVYHLAYLYQNADCHGKGIAHAKQYSSMAETTIEKISAYELIIRGLLETGGQWQEAYSAFKQQKTLLNSLIASPPKDLKNEEKIKLYNSCFFFPYFEDSPQENRKIQNSISKLCQIDTENLYPNFKNHQSHKGKVKLLKIGYLSRCLKPHSVGWLARAPFKYHNREKFQIHGYLIAQEENQSELESWYIHQMDGVYKSLSSREIIEQISQDEIDILVDLDSITVDTNCKILREKPATIQVTWLGWDASGIPTIDYFIADPYVLPNHAQDYYQEKIWRLPQTYIAVDGFEVGIPTLRRNQLNINPDAIIYFSGQKGYKRHPDTIHLQMKILQQVPNSYLLIKGTVGSEEIQETFNTIAREEGVNPNRLRFLDLVPTEAIHRANLGIADIILDTYPFNGATTTMETLWMGIPMVTRVGEQFAARNSYTMMINAGISEGISWTDQEYVEWGIRLGKDSSLRQKISWKLRQSRQISPLWNGREFTYHLEDAYQQMWQKYLEKY